MNNGLKQLPGHRRSCSALLLWVGLLAVPHALGAVITLPAATLQANKANQKITVSISGMDAVAGEDFFAQIGDGGSINGGTNTKPAFTGVDILTGTIFGGNTTGATGDPNGAPVGSNAAHPLIWVDGTTSSSGTVTDNGLLATLTIDTTGVSSGTFPLLLKGVASTIGPFDTTLRDATGAPVTLTITNGSITIQTPEPTGMALLVVGGILLARRPRNRSISGTGRHRQFPNAYPGGDEQSRREGKPL